MASNNRLDWRHSAANCIAVHDGALYIAQNKPGDHGIFMWRRLEVKDQPLRDYAHYEQVWMAWSEAAVETATGSGFTYYSDAIKAAEQHALVTATPNLDAMLLIVAQDNGCPNAARFVASAKELRREADGAMYDLAELERQAASLSEDEREVIAAGEYEDMKAAVAFHGVGYLSVFLDKAFNEA